MGLRRLISSEHLQNETAKDAPISRKGVLYQAEHQCDNTNGAGSEPTAPFNHYRFFATAFFFVPALRLASRGADSFVSSPSSLGSRV